MYLILDDILLLLIEIKNLFCLNKKDLFVVVVSFHFNWSKMSLRLDEEIVVKKKRRSKAIHRSYEDLSKLTDTFDELQEEKEEEKTTLTKIEEQFSVNLYSVFTGKQEGKKKT